MAADDLDAVRRSLGLSALPYADLAARRALAQLSQRWPWLPLTLPQTTTPPMHLWPGPCLLALQGLRGGVGVTSLVAGLAQALHALGQRVLILELDPAGLLRHHAALPAGPLEGWACAELEGADWRDCAWRLQPGLHLLPYGTLSGAQRLQLEQDLQARPGDWTTRLRHLPASIDWVVCDLPLHWPGHAGSLVADLHLRVIEADPACHLRLQESLAAHEWLLVNRYDPTRRLSQDLWLLWQTHLQDCLVPSCLHEDEAVREALAARQLLAAHAPDSLFAEDLRSLATWCLARAARARGEPAPGAPA